MTEQHSYRILDVLIEQDAYFAIFRLPHETAPRFVMQTSGTPSILRDIEELNEQQGFVIAPFRTNATSPLIVIRPDRTTFPEVNISIRKDGQEKAYLQKHISKNKVEYSYLFDRFHKPLANGELKKLVLSRSKIIDRKDTFSPGRSFFNAVEKYPHSYVYLFHTPQSGTWLGSTPEILLRGVRDEWHTVALAGTRYPNSGTVTWDDKNLREQHLVTSYLLKQLSSFHITPEINGPYTIKAGNLAHLRTDFSFNLPETPKPGTLLKALHPTPAVSGLPKDEAYRFIQHNEEQDRLYYSGFLGMLDTEGETDIYVNLRCMHIEKNLLTLFAGSGLLVSSSLDDEWEETEHKLEVMLNILQ
ncbi:isochorismate synthases [Proteiniphilum saccharofermentans]|uniref:isochorismate synthase n=1 Tax=Proteiniphilum saccharofermentans TaxID=1642647 RepID=A0A1R3TCK8_9BACT|nr:isochorismate synthase [Proteiniphilum saccharofermentans]SCD21334.1 isochorismate synthases [Proteiniphilum saccharofermentans]